MKSIWRFVFDTSIEETFRAFAEAQNSEAFYAAAGPVIREASTDDEARIAETLNQMDQQIAELEAKGDMMADIANMLSKARNDLLRDMATDEDVDEAFFADMEAPGNPEDIHPIFQGDSVVLAESHMFFDGPYVEIPYEDIEAQVQALLERYETAFSNAIETPAERLDIFGDPDESLEAEDLWLARLESEAGYALGTWHTYWVSGDSVFYLSHEQEDKELPISIGFGRIGKPAFERAVKDVQAITT